MKKNTTILLVEDEEITAHMQSKQLEKKGYTVKHFLTGEEAIEFTLKNRASLDLILIDIDLGDGVYGTDVAKQILKKTDIPIVFLSGHTSGEMVEKAEKISAYGYIIKNAGIAVIDASIKMALKLFDAKKEAEENKKKLAESEKKYRKLTENTETILWEFDILSDKWTHVSPQVKRILGYEPEEWTNLEFWTKHLHPDDREWAVKYCAECTQKGEDHIFEYRFRKKSGKYAWLHDEVKVEMKKGKPVKMWGAMLDITEKKEAELALMKSNILNEQVSEQSRTFTWETNSEGVYTFVTPVVEKVLGYHPDELIGKKTVWELHPEKGREKFKKEIFENFKTSKKISGLENPMITKEGKTIWIESSGIPVFDNEGNIIKHRGSDTDITERKKAEEALRSSEQKYRTLLENAFDGIYLLEGRKYIYANKQFCRLTGYTYEEVISNDFDFSQLLTEESKELVEHRYSSIEKGENIPNVYESNIKTKSGRIIDVEISTTIIKRKKQPFVLGIIRDITKHKQAQKLEREILVAKKAAEFKQKFLANMSHEIRTPLSGMLGFIDLLADTNLEQDQKLFVDSLRHSGENLKEIINLILDYSKIESGKITLKNETFSLKYLFENLAGLFYSICHKNIKLNTSISSKLPEYIVTDRQRLYQVLSNLVSNAVKFTEKGEVSIKAKPATTGEQLKKSSDNNSVIIKIEVKDTGIGIKPEGIKDLFKPFSQVDNSEVRNIEGTGLGLSICKELVNMLGGEIDVKSKPGEGSNFWFTFKAEIAEKSKIDQIKQNRQKESKKTNTIPSLNVLLVDDRKVNLTVTNLMLKSNGHNVDLAENGEEAIKKFRPGKYDIILMDIQMPVMDGVTATKELKKKHKDIPPIIGLSAHAMEGDREKYMQRGMDEYIIKPIKDEDFEKVVIKLGLTES